MLIEQLFSFQVLPWLCLLFTIALAFVKPKLWPYALLITLSIAFLLEVINTIGVSVIVALLALSFGGNKLSNKIVKSIITTLVIVGCIALAAHIMPGFNNLLVIDDVEKSINSVGFTMYLNFDKPMILFSLLLLYPSVLVENKKGNTTSISKSQLSIFCVLAMATIYMLALALSLVEFEPTIPSWWWLFALNNLLLTCVVEEVFFRGYIQQKLTKTFTPIIGLCVASVLFGVAHFAGGGAYVLVNGSWLFVRNGLSLNR